MPDLIWEGKYDQKGRRVPPLRVSLPFQTVETVNESAQDRQRSLNLFASGRDSEWRNRVIWGDKKYVLPALLDEFAGAVDLIYIDPPFDTGADFSFRVQVDGDGFVKEPSIIEQKAYRDTWGVGPDERARGITHVDRYLYWFSETVAVFHELLSNTGSLYVHLDWHVGHYAKIVLDEIFGSSNFRNEIYWYYYNKMPDTRKGVFPRATDTLLFYVKDASSPYTFSPLTEKRDVPVRQLARKKVEGRMVNVRDEGGKVVYQVREDRVVDNVWRISMLQPADRTENVFYQTQKPTALLKRVIQASSKEGDLVLDCFVGSGTTAVVAEQLNRRWVVADLSRFSIHTTRKRLLSLSDVRPFVVQNLGKYERQLWQAAEFGESSEARTLAYRRFILELYRASPIEGYTWLHGLKEGRMVHVGSVDAPVTVGDVKQIAVEFKKAVGTGKDAPKSSGADVLGWDFAFEVNEVAKQEAAEANIIMRFIRIPREVLDKRAVQQGDVKFFELAALSVDLNRKGRTVTLKLTNFMIPLDDVPEDVQRAIKNWKQWIDYWAVDWDNQGDTFHNEWQTYRMRERKELETAVRHEYEKPGSYKVVVKVIDILGNDTTKTLKVEVS
jgi:adenine-specific DNA-methyltransferase